MNIKIFNKDDNQYLKWMNTNPSYFIVNTERTKNTSYSKLHKAKCHHISTTTTLDKGAYTERNYIKVGSDDINELKNWFVKNKPNFTGEFSECKTCNPFTEKFIDNPVFLFPDMVEESETDLFEGALKQITVNSYERNPKARLKCLNHHGYTCTVCDLNFENKYGIIGKDFIHVHHLKEISEIKKNYKIDPIKDLSPVCPNCHSMLHQRKPCYSIDELKEIIKKASK